ncbi:MAG TPA: hypothetical protein VMU11_04130 [Verrucomicrobiae bacterium]|nr:hypothetical protein [Verrucomicrobiae bacterium]
MKILQNKWNSFFIACLIWLASVFIVVAVDSIVHSYKSPYEGGFYQCLNFNLPGWYECGYGSYLLNIATDRYPVTLRMLSNPMLLLLPILFAGEGGGPSIQFLFLFLLSMPYTFIPVVYLGLRKFNSRLIQERAGSPPARG